MNILGWNPGHDGAIALLSDGTLEFSLEAEKNGLSRHAQLDSYTVLRALGRCSQPLDALAISGWISQVSSCASGYFGTEIDKRIAPDFHLFGRKVRHFSPSHERSHIFCSFGMSPYPDGTPFYALIWEGTLGSFYEVDPALGIKKFKTVIPFPGERYVLPYALAANMITHHSAEFDPGVIAGKVMALTAFADDVPADPIETMLVQHLLSLPVRDTGMLRALAHHRLSNSGVESEICKRISRLVSDQIYSRFFDFAKQRCTKHLPLVIGGGCGLNCEWNSRLRDSGLFEDVFVPPCTNDSGVAIGAAVDAQFQLTGSPKIRWDAYRGDDFVFDSNPPASEYIAIPYSAVTLSKLLENGCIIAWIHGRAEIGPRALGARSLLASPLLETSHTRLNRIKSREQYRPIAPVCLEEDIGLHFSPALPSPHMLFLHRVRANSLVAVTHVDGTARVQTVNEVQNAKLYGLLRAFKNETGIGVLRNTSLNLPGRGFISRTSDLLEYVSTRDVQGMVLENTIYLKSNISISTRRSDPQG